MVKYLAVALIAILAGSISGISGERVYQKYFESKAPEIAVVDLKKLVIEHQNDIMKKYPGVLSDEAKKEVQAKAEDFASKLTKAVGSVNKDHVLIIKDAVIGESRDLTDQIRRMIDDAQVSR